MGFERKQRLLKGGPREIIWPMGVLAVGVLLVSVGYAVLALVYVPSLGIDLDDQWRVTATTHCQPNDWWCDALNPTLRLNDQVTAIAGIDYEAFISNPARYLFTGWTAGDVIRLRVVRDGQTATIPWQLPQQSARDRLMRVSETLLFVPFYLAGTAILLMLRPRGVRSRILVAAFYTLALWLASNSLADSHAAFSAVFERLSAWMLLPLLCHLHLLIPSQLTQKAVPPSVVALYGMGAVMGVLDVLQLSPIVQDSWAMILAVVGVAVILLLRLWRSQNNSAQRAVRMLTLAFGATMIPLVLVHQGWHQHTVNQSQLALMILASFTAPIMPLTYLYVIHRRWVIGMRLGFHRRLAQYGFMLVYVIMYVILSSLGARLIESPDSRVLFTLLLALIFIGFAPQANSWFKRGFVFMAVGARHEVDEISHYLASQLPQVRTFNELGVLLGEVILPGLLIRQSALLLLDESHCSVLYSRGGIDAQPLCQTDQFQKLLDQPRVYRPPGKGETGIDDWVRLVIPLKSQDHFMGLWLFGERDPDDYYSPSDIRLISVLANQVMLGIDNLRRERQTLRQTHELSTLYELLLASSATLDRKELLDIVRERLDDLVSPEIFIVYQSIPERHAWKVLYSFVDGGYTETGMAREVSFEVNERLDSVLATAEVVRGGLKPEEEKGIGPRSWMGVPMISQGRVIGVLYLEAEGLDAFSALDRRLIEAIGGQLATSLSNVQLYESANRRALEQEAVNRIIAAASRVADVPELLNIALDRLMLALGIGQGLIWLDDPEITFVRGFAEQSILQEVLEGIRMIRINGESSVVENWLDMPASVDPWANRRQDGTAPIGASLTVPLLAEGHVLGGLALVSQKSRHWDSNEIHLAAIIGRQIGGAIERLNLLDQIRQQAEQMQGILETMGEGLLTLNQDNQVTLANSVARQYLEVLSDMDKQGRITNLGGVSIEQVVSGGRSGMPYELIVGGQPARVFEIQSNHTQDSVQYGEWTLLIREVTDIRRAQSQSQLQERLAAVGQIAAGIAHDFNNIVASILLFSEMLLAEPAITERGRDRLAAINHQAQRAANLTRQILDFGRQTGVDLKPIDLVPLLSEEAELLKRTLPANIAIRFSAAVPECVVSANPGQIEQLLLNLVLNARDAMPEGGELAIQIEEIDLAPKQRPPIDGMPPGQWMRLTVKDTGVGIAPAIRDRIFEPFFTTKPPGKGTGLGLAQVYGIVQQHSGFIDVDSLPDQGTEFMIFLPILSLGVTPKPEAGLSESPSGKGQTILLVEDQEELRQAVTQVLENLNYKVLSANHGLAAQKILEEQDFSVDLVISDVVMPEMGGMALYRWLMETAPEIKVIIMSGYPMGDGTRELLDPQRVRLLHKPMDARTLALAVEEALSGSTVAGDD